MAHGRAVEVEVKKKTGPKGPSKYYPELCQEIIDFFDIEEFKTIKIVTTGKNDYCKEEEVEVANPLPHLIDFARKIGVNPGTISEWAKKYPEFSDALKEAKEINERMLTNNALKSLYNPTFSIFMAKNKFGWRDEQHIKTNGPSTVIYVSNNPHLQQVLSAPLTAADPEISSEIQDREGREAVRKESICS